MALLRPNRSRCQLANYPCGSRADGGEVMRFLTMKSGSLNATKERSPL